jgi:hypothetical protein
MKTTMGQALAALSVGFLPGEWLLSEFPEGYRTLSAREAGLLEIYLEKARDYKARNNTMGCKAMLLAAYYAQQHLSGIEVDLSAPSDWISRL